MGGVFRPKPPAPPPPPPAPTPAPVTPTVAEVSQSQAADAYDPRKTKAKGRSSTIMTSSKGVEDETLTLGKKSLLGR
ncbi:hypothetical protein HTVC034P_gp57 [Pelagibacter phage HTVC034P]|jgi:hypothetical protein|nr:hypothetical protein HTVC034P_gp57 [Pelagibacter phage HTVC034P]|tara:strand:- start:32 stop:262 length:231 start_codon:yes stop_codon:yes gene_type:complete